MSLAELIAGLNLDVWRPAIGFSPDIHACSDVLLSDAPERRKIMALRDWVSRFQPCVFGRVGAAAPDLIEFCLLGPTDLQQPDGNIQDKVQDARARWKRGAETGDKSAFVLIAAADALMQAAPDNALQRVAIRLFELYLSEERNVRPDTVYLDKIVLADDQRRSYRTFVVSSDVFAVQGDRRWWHDHRFPGGIAFSFNSPGHMAEACRQRMAILEAEQAALQEIDLPGQLRRVQSVRAELCRLQRHQVSTPGQVLKFAMNTISGASEQVAGDNQPGWTKAVRLLRRHTGSVCPMPEVETDRRLSEYDFEKYLGWYHTDYTVPSIFFRPDQTRPGDLTPYALDLTYIYDPKAEDYRARTLGVLRRARRGGRR